MKSRRFIKAYTNNYEYAGHLHVLQEAIKRIKAANMKTVTKKRLNLLKLEIGYFNQNGY